jgi:hypothetical protein
MGGGEEREIQGVREEIVTTQKEIQKEIVTTHLWLLIIYL